MLSTKSLDFLSNKENFELKNQIDKEVGQLLHEFQNKLANLLNHESFSLPTKLSKQPGKINKGNNHKGFPFQVSDFPAVLGETDAFSFRAVVWYGNFFSFSLILKGQIKNRFQLPFIKLLDKGFSLSLNENIWETTSTSVMNLPINNKNQDKAKSLISESEGIRIFKTYSLNQIHDFERLGVECFREFFA